MASRRPRVPRSAMSRAAVSVPSGQTELVSAAETAAEAASDPQVARSVSHAESHPVTRHSAKVIPLDSAPRQQSRPRPTPEQRRAAERRALLERSVRPHVPSAGTSARPEGPAGRPAGAERKAPGAGGGRPSSGASRSTGSAARPVKPTGIPATHGSTESVTKVLRAQQPRTQAPVKPIPARSFSGRSIALLVVTLVAAILVTPTLRVFLNQQAELTGVQTEIEQQRELQGELTAQIKRWEDPAYVQQQARDRLNLVMPGEKKYMVIGGEAALPETAEAASDPGAVNPDMPWADGLWDSVVRAATD